MDGRIRVGVDASSRMSHSGPKVFMRRLCDDMHQSGKAVVVPYTTRSYDIGLFASRPKDQYGNPYVIRLDGVYFDTENTRGDNDALNAPTIAAVERAVGVIFQSEYCRKLYQKHIGSTDCMVSVCHNGADTNLFQPKGVSRRRELGLADQDQVIVMSAHWRAHKRLKDGVELFKLMRDGSEGSFKLLILGRRPDYIVDDPDVIYVGEIEPDQLAPYYRTGDVFLTTSWLEPAGNVHIEALACGLPVVCMNNGGAKESVLAANGGIVVDADLEWDFTPVAVYNPPSPNYDAVISALLRIFENSEKYRNRIKPAAIAMNTIVDSYVGFLKRCLTT